MPREPGRRRTTHAGAAARVPGLTLALLGVLAIMGCMGDGGRAVSRSAPTGAQFTTEVAEELIRQGDVELALREFERAIEQNPDFVRAHVGIADLYRMEGDYASAQGHYERASRITPTDPDLHYYNGLMLQLLDRIAEAIQAYLRVLRLAPDHFETHLNLANAYHQLDEDTQALRYAQEAVRLDPESGDARLTLAEVYAALGQHGAAVVEYQQAAELMDLTPMLLRNWARSLQAVESFEQMRNVLTRLAADAPSADVHERLGFARFRLGEFGDAKASFEAALALDPDYVPALNGVAVCLLNDYLASDRRDRAAQRAAVESLRRSLRLNPEQPKVKELLSRYGK